MKKKMIVLLAGALLALGASNALADLSNTDLIRVVYNVASNVEAIADLGSIASLQADPSGTVVGNGNASFLSNGITSANIGTSYVAYFAIDITNQYLWVSGSTTTPTGIAGLKMASSGAALDILVGTWITNMGTNSYYQGNTTAAPSYYQTADGAGQKDGTLDAFINAATKGNTEAALATGGTATQGLWYFANGNATTLAGQEELELVTNANGSTTIEVVPAATPIPPSFFLMGSGLLGMFGLRRKQRA